MDVKNVVDREILRAAVAKEIFCQMSKRVLDVKTTIGIEINFTSGNVTMIVIHVDEWKYMEPQLPKFIEEPKVASVKIYDGPALWRASTVSKKPKGVKADG